MKQLIEFRLEANVNTYAGYKNETTPTRLDSHDFTYSNGSYTYHDTYVGGEKFAGEEAIWYEDRIQYAMNYCGRVLGQLFSGDFLKEALRKADITCILYLIIGIYLVKTGYIDGSVKEGKRYVLA